MVCNWINRTGYIPDVHALSGPVASSEATLCLYRLIASSLHMDVPGHGANTQGVHENSY